MCKEKKNREEEGIELTGSEERERVRRDRNGEELIWCWLPAKN